jgi:hypothetical protein
MEPISFKKEVDTISFLKKKMSNKEIANVVGLS